MLAVLHALTVLLSANPTPHSVLASNEQRIADSGSLFIGTIILRWQQQHSNAEAEDHALRLGKHWVNNRLQRMQKSLLRENQ
jgi:hypothetical protein